MPQSRSLLKAVLWMLGTLASFLFMGLAGRELSAELTVFQILFFRTLICLIIMLFIVQMTGWSIARTGRLHLHGIRNTIHFAAQCGWFLGLAYLPLAEVFALEFTTPIWTAIFAALFLGEHWTRTRVVAITLGFIGILVILRPGIAIMHPASFAVLAAAIGYACTYALTKGMVNTEQPLTVLFYMHLIQFPLGLLLSISDWTMPSMALWPWVIIVGIAGFTSHYCLSKALTLADATVVVPIDFLRLPLAAVIAFLIYHEPLDIFLFLGALLIFSGNYLNIWQAAKKAVS